MTKDFALTKSDFERWLKLQTALGWVIKNPDGLHIEHHPKMSILWGTKTNDWFCLMDGEILRAAGSLAYCEAWQARISKPVKETTTP
jgi:hypothetical protein